MIDTSQLEESMRMPQIDLRSHFRGWVPHWLKMVVAFVTLIPILLINGTYTGSNIDIVGSLGVLVEDINMSYYASSAGMAIAHLVIPRIKPIATSKTIILVGLLFQVFLSFICAKTSYVEITIFCSFWIGYLKGFAMSEVIVILMPELSKQSGTRNEFYAKFYPITIGVGQISLVLTAELAYRFEWQYMYYFMILLLLVSLLAVVSCMSYARRLDHLPLKEIDWHSFFLVSVCFMSILYVTTYGKINNWFVSPSIVAATILIPITGWLFIRRQLNPDREPFADLSILKNRSSTSVYILSFLLMFFASFSVLISSYTTNILRLGSDKANELYLFMLPGLAIGGILCYYFYLKAIRMAWLIFIGFACFTISIAILYFNVSPTGLYEDLYLPMFLRGMGMVILFVAFGVYGVQGLKLNQLIYNAFFMISFRSVLAPAIGSCILTNWLYRSQQANMMILGESVDVLNPVALTQFNSSVKTALSQGWSLEDAHMIATNALYSKVQLQATLVSIKSILGWMLILGIIVMVAVLLYFFQFKPVRWIKIGNDMTN